MPSLNTEQPRSYLNDRAYARLKHAIVSCELAPGAEISESALASRLRLGKASIRSALARLRQEGFVSPIPRRGYRVSPVTLADAHEVFDARLLIEPALARIAAHRLTPELLSRLRSALTFGFDPGDRRSERKFLEASREFYLGIAEVAGNSRLTQITARLLAESHRILHVGLSRGDCSARFLHDHLELLAALEDRNGESAFELMEKALKNSYESIRDALLTDPSLWHLPLSTRTTDAR